LGVGVGVDGRAQTERRRAEAGDSAAARCAAAAVGRNGARKRPTSRGGRVDKGDKCDDFSLLLYF
jgi:hypothetical protein